MAVQRGEIGLVAADDRLVAFYRDVFGLVELDARRLPMGTVHRLGAAPEPGPALIKVMVPSDRPAPAPSGPEEFWTAAGLRYFTLWVDDVAATAQRVGAHGGQVTRGPLELRPGVHTMVVRDPDGNALEVMQDDGA